MMRILAGSRGSVRWKQESPKRGVEGFAKVQSNDHGWGFSSMACAYEVCSEDKVFSYATPWDEPSLVAMDKQWYYWF